MYIACKKGGNAGRPHVDGWKYTNNEFYLVITPECVAEARSIIKNGKTCAPCDNLYAELLKYSGKRKEVSDLDRALALLWTRMLNLRTVPDYLRECAVAQLFNGKCCLGLPNNYRCIVLFSVLGKLFSKCIDMLLSKYMHSGDLCKTILHPAQGGFCPGRGCPMLLHASQEMLYAIQRRVPEGTGPRRSKFMVKPEGSGEYPDKLVIPVPQLRLTWKSGTPESVSTEFMTETGMNKSKMKGLAFGFFLDMQKCFDTIDRELLFR